MLRSSLLSACILLAACGGGASVGGDNSGGTPDANSCIGPLGPPITGSQLTGMDACCQAQMGAAHCLTADRTPSQLQGFVDTCDDGGYCIPDSFLETGGAVPPKTCSAFGGDGVCLSKCIPQVAMNAALLQKDVCEGADDLCVPCISPLDNMPTGACDLRELAVCQGDTPPPAPAACDDPSTCNYEANCPPVIDPSTLTACAPDAHCLDATLIADPAEKAQLAACPSDATKLCVPDIFLETGGKFTLATCNSVNGNEGRCLSTSLPAIAGQAALLPQDSCGANEKCAPCFNPVDGSDTGACKLSCDTGPTKAAVPFADCCSARAKCVSTDSIPDDQEGNLGQKSCDDGQLCVPDQILENDPIDACTANSILVGDYTGVCLSDCLDFGFAGIAIAKGSCGDHLKCAPCTNPLTGDPTGAPGCPQ